MEIPFLFLLSIPVLHENFPNELLLLRNNLLKIYFDSSALSLPSLQLSLLVNEKIKIQTRISSCSDS